ncbi:MAG: D-alanyl-D-alanine carboxypeptidase [Rhodospirillales bacterium]|nr:MAG: D-alanyl-D-alanine carboxypeptidase [Rhodospirillales bacterium]
MAVCRPKGGAMTVRSSSGGRLRSALILLALAVVMPLLLAKPAAANPRYAAIVVDADTGVILHERHADLRRYPASLTKMMTLYLLFDALESGRVAPGTRFTVSAHAAAQPPSKLGLKPGQTITVEQAILALVTRSANDVSVVVAEGLGGSVSNFAAAMTAKARQLGMSRTTFRNPHGLPDEGQISTARDMATLAVALLRDHRKYYGYFATRSFSFAGTSHQNHNRLLASYRGMDGIKTGYIRASGFNLVASAERNGRRLIGVVFGGQTAQSRNAHMAELLDRGFHRLDTVLVAGAGAGTPRLAAVTAAPRAASGSAGGGTGTWAIQVGAFLDRDSALRTAQRARAQIPSVVGTGAIHVEPSQVQNGPTYQQARIVNIGREEAHRACTLLKQRNFRCMVVRLPAPVATASPAAARRILGAPSPKPEILRDLSMGTGAATGPVHLETRPSSPAAMMSTAGGWGVQVGAFRERDPALRLAAAAARQIPATAPDGAVTVVERPMAGRNTLYLARIHGLSRDDASASCAELKRRGRDCLVVEVAETVDLDALARHVADVGDAVEGDTVASMGDADAGRAGNWAIQVGAFPARTTARSVAERAQDVLPATLQPGTIRVDPLARRSGGTLYQARIVGIDRDSAQTACRLLSLQKFDCLVMRADQRASG